jgi:hypothetical protein
LASLTGNFRFFAGSSMRWMMLPVAVAALYWLIGLYRNRGEERTGSSPSP